MKENHDNFYAEVVNSVDIVEAIQKYITLTQPTGTYLEGKCPFNENCGHSFIICPESKSYYCFGCHSSGDVITFISKIGNITRMTAAKFLKNLQKSETWVKPQE